MVPLRIVLTKENAISEVCGEARVALTLGAGVGDDILIHGFAVGLGTLVFGDLSLYPLGSSSRFCYIAYNASEDLGRTRLQISSTNIP